MDVSRRGLFGWLAGAAALTAVPAKAVAEIFAPPVIEGATDFGNALLTPSIIARETLTILENNLVAAGRVNRQFENMWAKHGHTLTIRKPSRFVVSGTAPVQARHDIDYGWSNWEEYDE